MIEAIPRPEGKSTDYQFFVNHDTGNRFKAKVAITEAAPVRLGDGAAANLQFGACITTAMIDDEDRAVREGTMPVIDSWTHTFTPIETSEPGFDIKARIAAILEARIMALEARHAARASLVNLRAEWTAEPLNLKGAS